MAYAIPVLFDNDKLNLPDRTYIFSGADNDGQPDWCFAYGEREWVEGKMFKKVKDDAKGDLLAAPKIQPIGRVNCSTGELIQ